MEKIELGKYVELGYDLYEVAADGTQIGASNRCKRSRTLCLWRNSRYDCTPRKGSLRS